MSNQQQVVIIDDNKLSLHNWKILLNFIGESVLSFDAQGWSLFFREEINRDTILALMIGELKDATFDENALAKLVTQLHAQFPAFPILVNCDETYIREKIPESSQAWIIQLPDKPDHETVIRLLGYTRQLRGVESKKSESRIISEHGTALFRSLVGDSPEMTAVRALMHQVAKRNVNVLLLGEAGTGKEVVARNIHYHSGRGENPFVIVNCSAWGEEFGSRLFGQGKLLSGRPEGVPGFLEKADGGILFLDKITEMPLGLQARLQGFLESKSFQRPGEDTMRQVDVRVIVATNADLKQKVAAGEFREDLYFALSVVPIRLPALREHAEDIPALIRELITRLESENVQAVSLNSSAIDALKTYAWPGNVRELANLIERLSIIHEGNIVGLNELPLEYREHFETQENTAGEVSGDDMENPATSGDKHGAGLQGQQKQDAPLRIIGPLGVDKLKHYLQAFDREMLTVALQDSAGIHRFAAERLGLENDKFEAKMQQSGLLVSD